MDSNNLDNLVSIGQLKKEPFEKTEFIGLVDSGIVRLKDANLNTLSQESRFDLAYNAAHSLALAALRYHGYRSNNRFIVFQVLPQTAQVDAGVWRILAKCHAQRNLAEYEGHLEIDDILLTDLLKVTNTLKDSVLKLYES